MGTWGGFWPGEDSNSHRCATPRGRSTTNHSLHPATYGNHETFVRGGAAAGNSSSFIKGLIGHWGG